MGFATHRNCPAESDLLLTFKQEFETISVAHLYSRLCASYLHSTETMVTARHTILTCGLGRFVGKHPGAAGAGNLTADEIHKAVEASHSEAASLGFDCESFDVDPENPADTVRELKERLATKKWDGVSIGFGIRGKAEYTKLFEDAVNAVRETAPGAKMMFSVGPMRIVEAIKRTFPEDVEEKRK